MPGPHITHAPCEEYTVAPIGVELDPMPRAFYIGTAGDLTLTDLYGNTVTFFNVVPGSVIPVAATYIAAAPPNTVALY